jgi:hypothetical protein
MKPPKQDALVSGSQKEAIQKAGLQAITEDDAQALSRAFDSGFDPEGPGLHFHSPVFRAIWSNSHCCLAVLLKKGANPNAACSTGRNAAMEASIRGHLECLRVLSSFGARFTAAHSTLDDCAQLARLFGHRECAAFAQACLDDKILRDAAVAVGKTQAARRI